MGYVHRATRTICFLSGIASVSLVPGLGLAESILVDRGKGLREAAVQLPPDERTTITQQFNQTQEAGLNIPTTGIATESVSNAKALKAVTNEIDGSKSHLPALSATVGYHAGAGLAEQIRRYRASGEYVRDRMRITERAKVFLDSWMKQTCKPTGCSPAVVFDFDDTLVSWYEILDKTGFTSDSSVTRPAMRNCATPPIDETIALLKYAQKNGIEVYVISGRTESMRAETEACMAEIGVSQAGLILVQPEQEHLTARAYKSHERAKLQKAGKTIGLSIGDQVSDVAGGFAAGLFVIPNPMYFAP